MAGEHILVVEDDDVLRSGIGGLLVLAGYVVSTAADGVEALELLDRLPQPPDLIVSDIRMPRLDGSQLLARVRARPEWLVIPFIFLAAQGDSAAIREGRLRGADDFIPKPFPWRDLLMSIRASLSRHSELRALHAARLHIIMAWMVSEVRTRLSSTVGFAGLMEHAANGPIPDALRQCVGGIHAGGGHLARVLNNFYSLASLENCLAEKRVEQHRISGPELVAMLEEAVACRAARAGQRGIALALEVGPGIPPILGDDWLLQSALAELLDNAVSFSPENTGAAVTVSLRAVAPGVSIRVCDEGPGIAPETQERLFSTYYPAGRSERERAGRGIGLAAVRRVAQLHGGHVRLRSEPDSGNCFEMRLPLVSDGSDGNRGCDDG